MNKLNITMYLYHNVIPSGEVTLKRCDKCNRPLFKYSATELIISNAGPSHFIIYEPGVHFIEHICHSCGSKYTILFM